MNLSALEQRSWIGHVEPDVLGPVLKRRHRRNEDHGAEVAAIADHHDLFDELARLELVFDRLGRHVLAARGLDQVLLAIGDPEEAVVVELADVAGVEPAFRVDRGSGGLGQVVVPLHDLRAPDQDLPVLGDLDLRSGHGLPHGADTEVLEGVHVGHGARLGEPVALEDREADRVEEPVELGRKRGRAADEIPEVSAHGRPDFLEDERVGELVSSR